MRRMTNLVAVTALATCLLVALTAQLPAADAPNPLDQAIRAVGTAGLTQLDITGFGSAVEPGSASEVVGTRTVMRHYGLDVDFAHGRAVAQWQLIGRRAARANVGADELVWRTPHGFLLAAAAHDSTMRTTPLGQEVSFELDGRRVVGTIGMDGLVDRVRAWTGSSDAGFVEVQTFFRDYERYGPVRFPRHIAEYRDEALTLDVWVTDVDATVAPRRLRWVTSAD